MSTSEEHRTKTDLIQLVEDGNVEGVRQIIQSTTSCLNEKDYNDHNALFYAVNRNSIGEMVYLSSSNA